jgi:hypothetical protein
MPENFSKSLLRAAKDDAPPPDAKVRAMAHVENVLTDTLQAAAAGNGALAAATTLGTAKVAIAAAVMAGAIGLGGGYELGRTSQPRGVSSTPAKMNAEPRTSTSDEAPQRAALVPPVAAAPAPAAAAAPADVCAAAETTSSGNCSAAKPGKSVTFAIKTRCSEASLDVFFVDESCHEVFRGIIAPGATFWQDSWEGHVFRVRDHATRRLVSEVAPTRVTGAEDRETYWKGARTELPLVVVHESDLPIPEGPAPECTRGGGRAAMLHVRNDRKTEPVALMRVDFDCKETGKPQMIAPGTVADVGASEGHAFRVRDASGALLLDVVPTLLDTSTYITVP